MTRKLNYNPAYTRPIPYPETERITVSPSHFHPASRLQNASCPTSRLAFKPYPASRQTYDGPSDSARMHEEY